VHQHRRFSREEITTLVVADPVCCANDEDNDEDEDEDWEEEEEWGEEEWEEEEPVCTVLLRI
jgi:hypothetical protein